MRVMKGKFKMNKDKKYDIGIYTFWNVPNYGTFAQAYALQKVVQNMFPNKSVKQIAYLDEKHYNFYYSRVPSCKIWHKQFYKELFTRNTKSVNAKRDLFLKNYNTIPHTEEFTKSSLQIASFDTVIIGSDIVWDYSFDCFNNDHFLFGLNFNAKNIISYAASFGTIKKSQKHPDYVIDGLKKFKYITVRENNSAEIVENVLGYKPGIVLDPTWLWDFNNDPRVEKSPFKHYLVVYGQDFTKSFIEEIKEYSRKKQLKLICLDCNNDDYSWCDVILHQDELTPYQWFGILKDADAVATSTYHGLTFGLIFNKKMAFCKSEFILAKASSFLKELNLYDLYTNDSNGALDMLDKDWDYHEINKKIEIMRQKSLNQLREMINN